jgi:hypothetical protein
MTIGLKYHRIIKKKPKIIGENSTHCIPTTMNHFELLSDLTKMQTTTGQKRIKIKNYETTQDAYRGSLFTRKTPLWVIIK